MKKSINIPAVLVHTLNGNEYRVSGNIVGINEANETVSMKFKGYKGVEHDIPMSAVYVTEGIIDSIKNAGRKILSGIKKLIRKVKGFLFPMENGKPDVDYMNSPVNIAIMEAKGELPEGVHFYANQTTIDTAAENGVNVEEDVDPLDYDTAAECAQIETYWDRVMKDFVKNESLDYTVADAIKSVNEKFYVDKFSEMKRTLPLNEGAILDLDNPGFLRDKYGKSYGYKAAVGQVKANIQKQLTRKIGQGAVEKPIVVWGAPGIGKTMILKGIARAMKEDLDMDLMIMDVQCSSLTADDWGIPTINIDEQTGQKNATTVPKTWLPVYQVTNNPTRNRELDNHFNSGAYLPGEDAVHDGGIVFFDELSRLPQGQSQNLMMALVDQCSFESRTLASNWGLVFASNRLEDVRSGDVDEFIWETAKSSRFKHITYRPKLADWLEWARTFNKATGRQNIDESYCAFIEQSGERVWYDALVLGSRDNTLDADAKKSISAYQSNPTADNLENAMTVVQDDTSLQGHLTWNPRSWQKDANDSFFSELELGVFYGHPELYRSIFDEKGNINPNQLDKALKFLSPREWDRWAKNYVEELDPSGRMSRLAFIDTFRQKISLEGSFGINSAPAQEWETYNDYKKTFTPDVCAAIWETGKMPTAALQKDDEKYFEASGDYNATESSRWKSKTNLAQEVINLIMNGFPGGIEAARQMALADSAKIASAPNISPSDFDKVANKWAKKYTVKVGPNNVACLLGSKEIASKDPIVRQNYLAMFKTLENSQLAQMLANVAMYISKVGMQMKANTVIVDGDKYLSIMTGTFIHEIANDPETKEAMLHLTELKACKNDTAKKEALAHKLIGYAAAEILTRGKNREGRFAQSGSYE